MAYNPNAAKVWGIVSVHVAPFGTTAPSFTPAGTPLAFPALPSAWLDLGYLAEDDGIKKTNDLDTQKLVAYGSGGTLRTVFKSRVEEFALTPIELNPVAIDFFEGNAPGTTTASTTGVVTWTTGRFNPALFAMCIDGFDGTDAIRRYIASAQVSDLGDQDMQDDNWFSTPTTVTANVTSSGISVQNGAIVAALTHS